MATAAVIDVGTNSVKLVVARAPQSPGGAPEVVDEAIVYARAGEGLAGGGSLSAAAVARTAEAVALLAERARRKKAETICAIGTAAFRAAANGEAAGRFIADAAKTAFEVVTGEREASLGWKAAWIGRKPGRKSLLVDIGGGSLQVTEGSEKGPRRAKSLPWGAVVVLERHFKRDPPRPEELASLREALRREFRSSLRGFRQEKAEPILVIGGTASALASIGEASMSLSRSAEEGHPIPASYVEALLYELAAVPAAERARRYTLDAGRADVIVPGAAILLEILDALHAPGFRVSFYGVRFGRLLECFESKESDRTPDSQHPTPNE